MRFVLICFSCVSIFLTGAALAADTSTQETNKKVVVEFYEKGLNQKDFEAASADGIEGFKGFIGFLREKFPDSHSEIKQVFADGDYVILHVHAVREKGTRGNAIIDIFKLENGKIVEHWDAVQPIPEKSANNNGMF
jgi:predicted SnoaL-like aldol condensation-catalyzing enzyme